MARTQHSTDSILDAARRVVVQRGTRAATLEEIVRESGAPTGSIYYRFGSVDQLLARLWLRAAQRSQAIVQEVRSADPIESVVAGAIALYDMCLREPEDASLLFSFKPSDFLDGGLDDELRKQLETVNAPVEQALSDVGAEIFGSKSAKSTGIVIFAISELPYAFARQQNSRPGRPDPEWRAALDACVRTVLAGSKRSSG